METQCPRCQNVFEVDDRVTEDVACAVCGSRFRADPEATLACSPPRVAEALPQSKHHAVVSVGATLRNAFGLHSPS
jgi:hypothetical protein